MVGRVPISGSKNAVLPILAACLLTEEECRLKNVPRIEDVATMMRLLEGMGVQIRWLDPQQLQINAERLARSEVLAAMANRMRASFLLMGPLLARRSDSFTAQQSKLTVAPESPTSVTPCRRRSGFMESVPFNIPSPPERKRSTATALSSIST